MIWATPASRAATTQAAAGQQAEALVSVAALMPLAVAARSWSCISAISGETTTQVPFSITAGS